MLSCALITNLLNTQTMEEQLKEEAKKMDQRTIDELNTLLLLFPAKELEAFYNEFSKQMLLTTSTQVERHEALQKLLSILSQRQ